MSLGTMEQRTEGMKRQAQELIEQAYQRGFKAGREDRQDWEKGQADRLIEQGRNEAWEAARKLLKSIKESYEILSCDGDKTFEDMTLAEIFYNISASIAIKKLRAYEEKQEEPEEDEAIEVGDEVILDVNSAFDTNSKAIVISKDGNVMFPYNVMIATGDTDWVDRDDIRGKTGRTFPEIVEVLKKMQEGT